MKLSKLHINAVRGSNNGQEFADAARGHYRFGTNDVAIARYVNS